MRKKTSKTMKNKRLVIIGANQFQLPLIIKANLLGYETHVFAWEDGAVGAEYADYFYPISIIEKEQILEECLKIKPIGVVTIGSDLAYITVNYLSRNLGLVANPDQTEIIATNKHEMRKALERNNIVVPYYKAICEPKTSKLNFTKDIDELVDVGFPLIVKPTDRSGSRAVSYVETREDLEQAVSLAQKLSFEKCALVESVLVGDEYSCETISFNGKHNILQTTRKFTTNQPNFIEIAHAQPVCLESKVLNRITEIVKYSLDALNIKNGASHTEFRLDNNDNPHIIEIGARMGGDFIGSDLVSNSTFHDYLAMVIQVAVGDFPNAKSEHSSIYSAVRFAFNEKDCLRLKRFISKHPEVVTKSYFTDETMWSKNVFDSSTRLAHVIVKANDTEIINEFLGDLF